uniref:Uncharacterized protein n=1 Tax=viral metagenome TaxID=1070528 RepID=A0A6M3M464_9ZZZZ
MPNSRKKIRYEEFCEKPQQVLRKIEEFLRIEEYKYEELDKTSDRNQMQIDRLTKTETDIIDEEALPLLKKLGYKHPQISRRIAG